MPGDISDKCIINLIVKKMLTVFDSFPDTSIFDKRPFCRPNAIFARWRPVAEKPLYSSN
jgi:hypothetical protein